MEPAVDETLLRSLTPAVIGILVRRGADFAAAEDAVQESLLEAMRVWPDEPAPRSEALAGQGRLAQVHRRDPRGRIAPPARGAGRVRAGRRIPARRSTTRSSSTSSAPIPSLTPASAVALTLRAVGGLTTRQIAEAYLVPEATMGQRISRAKRTVADVRFDQTGDVATVVRVLYLVFNEGYSGDIDLAAEAIRLTRQLAARTDHPEVAGLLALMLLHHARRPARTRSDGSLVPLAEQDRSRWDTDLIAEGVEILQRALARDQLGEFQAQAAIAALHADAQTADETDWVQIVEWYDELVRITDSPIARLNRAVAVGEADGAAGRPGGTGPARPVAPPLHRGRGVPPRARRRPRDGGPPLRRGRPGRAQPRRARPPQPAGGAPQRDPPRLNRRQPTFSNGVASLWANWNTSSGRKTSLYACHRLARQLERGHQVLLGAVRLEHEARRLPAPLRGY